MSSQRFYSGVSGPAYIFKATLNCLKGNIDQTAETRGGAYMCFPERLEIILNIMLNTK